MSYFSYHNKNPGQYAHGDRFGFAGNNITNRGADILENLPSQKPSKTLSEAALKSLRLYRRCCRLIPAILRWHEITWRLEPVQAKLGLAQVFKEKAHLRDPALIDAWVTRGYERLIEAEQHHTYSTYLFQFLSPTQLPNDRGFSYLDEKKYKGKTTFLKTFYKGPLKTNY